MSDGQRDDDPPVVPTDLGALARYSASLADELGKLWSDALDLQAFEEAQPGTQARVAALLQALAARYTDRDQRLERHGVDVSLPDWPVAPGTVLELDLTTTEGYWRAWLIASLQAVESLAGALNGVLVPTGVAVDLRSDEELRRWFESGAFALVSSRSVLLERMGRLLDAAEAPLLGEEPTSPDTQQDALDAVVAAGFAYRRGDPEAALWHLLRAARITLQSSRNSGDKDDWEGLSARSDFSELADLLRAADEVAQHYADGHSVPTAMPLAGLLLPRVQRLVLAPPDLVPTEGP